MMVCAHHDVSVCQPCVALSQTKPRCCNLFRLSPTVWVGRLPGILASGETREKRFVAVLFPS